MIAESKHLVIVGFKLMRNVKVNSTQWTILHTDQFISIISMIILLKLCKGGKRSHVNIVKIFSSKPHNSRHILKYRHIINKKIKSMKMYNRQPGLPMKSPKFILLKALKRCFQ